MHPLFFQVNLQSLSLPTTKPGSHRYTRVNWSEATTANVQNYCDMLSHCIGALPSVTVYIAGKFLELAAYSANMGQDLPSFKIWRILYILVWCPDPSQLYKRTR